MLVLGLSAMWEPKLRDTFLKPGLDDEVFVLAAMAVDIPSDEKTDVPITVDLPSDHSGPARRPYVDPANR